MTTTTPTRPKAYSYIRFSTPEQALGDSKRRQLAKAQEYAERHNLELVSGAYEDLGISAYRGRNKNEGALADFLTATKDGLIEPGSYLLVESMDRISREKARRAIRALEDIVDAGITVVTLADQRVYTPETLDDDPTAFMYAFMVAIRAHEESEMKSMRLRDAWGKKKELAASKNTPITARTPAWLRLSSDRQHFEVIEERADVIRRIFREAASGKGQHSIAYGLNKDGIDTFGDGKRKAQHWHRSYVAKILQSPAVIGTFVPHSIREAAGRKVRDALEPIPGYFPAVVDEETYNLVRERLQRGSTPRVRASSGEVSNILAGLARCPLCGSTMTRVQKGPKGGPAYLVCTRAKTGAGCEYHAVNLRRVEWGVEHAACRDLTNVVPVGDPTLDQKLRWAADRWSDTRSKIDRLTGEIAAGNQSKALREALSRLEGELREIDAEIEAVSSRLSTSDRHRIERAVEQIQRIFSDGNSTTTQKNLSLRDAFSHVIVDFTTGDLAFHWKQGGTPTRIFFDFVPPGD